mgnify:CR=1 FL=1
MKKNIVGLSIATWLVDLAMRQPLSDGGSFLVLYPTQSTHGVPMHDLFKEAA